MAFPRSCRSFSFVLPFVVVVVVVIVVVVVVVIVVVVVVVVVVVGCLSFVFFCGVCYFIGRLFFLVVCRLFVIVCRFQTYKQFEE